MEVRVLGSAWKASCRRSIGSSLAIRFQIRFASAESTYLRGGRITVWQASPDGPNPVLLVCGYWSPGPIVQLLHTILADYPGLFVSVVCGENERAFRAAQEAFGPSPNVRIYGVVDTLVPLMAECSCVITKPGISTLLEAHAARRKLFLLKGMPVAEDNNARHALQHFAAEWFTRESFGRWFREAAHPAHDVVDTTAIRSQVGG